MSEPAQRRAVISGVGAVTAFGVGVDHLWQACRDGDTRVEPIPREWEAYADYTSRYWSPLGIIDYKAHGLSRADIMQNDPAALLVLLACEEALAHADLKTEPREERGNRQQLAALDATRTMILLGTGFGSTKSVEDMCFGQALPRSRAKLESLLERLDQDQDRADVAEVLDALRGPDRMSPLAIAMSMPNTAASAVSIKYSVTGAALTMASACAAGTVAVGHALQRVRSGEADVVIAGGFEHFKDPYGAAFKGFDLARTLASGDLGPEEVNRPFDRDRSGFLFGEGGAGVLIIEELEHAVARGAPVLAEVAGFAESSEANNPVALSFDGLQIEAVFRRALADADVAVADVDYVNTHGTGTTLNDEVEGAMIERVVGDRPLVNSTKSVVGHTIGASGALELIVTALSIRDQVVHESRNLENPIVDLNFAVQTQPADISVALSESFAFGGHNAAVVLKEASS